MLKEASRPGSANEATLAQPAMGVTNEAFSQGHTMRRGTHVEATDGAVGHIDEFVVNPENGHITRLVLREGHLWGKKDVIIPFSAVGDQTRKDIVSLNIDKHQIEALPTFAVHRRWA